MPDFKLNLTDLPEETYQKDDVLVEENATVPKVYVLKEGTVSVVAGGNEICQVSEPLTIFGEISKLLDTKASAKVVVAKPTTFYVIEDLQAYVQENPEAALHIAKVLAQRVVDMNQYYVQIKTELLKVDGSPAAKVSKRLWDVVVKLDRFWGREIL